MPYRDISAIEVNGSAASFRTGQRLHAAIRKGRMHVVAGEDRGIVISGAHTWNRGLRPLRYHPGMAENGVGNATGTFMFAIRGVSLIGERVTIPSPLALSGDDTSLTVESKKIRITFGQTTVLDSFDFYQVLVREAEATTDWYAIQELIPVTQSYYDYNLTLAELVDLENYTEIAYGPGREPSHDEPGPGFDDLAVWGERLVGAGQPETLLTADDLGTIGVSRIWVASDPFDWRSNYVARGLAVLHPKDAAVAFTGAEARRTLLINDDAGGQEPSRAIHFRLGDAERLLLRTDYVNPEGDAFDIELTTRLGDYYSDLGPNQYRFWIASTAGALSITGGAGPHNGIQAADADGYPFAAGDVGSDVTITDANGDEHVYEISAVQDDDGGGNYRSVVFTETLTTSIATSDAWALGGDVGAVGALLSAMGYVDIVDADGVCVAEATAQMAWAPGGWGITGGDSVHFINLTLTGGSGTLPSPDAAIWSGAGIKIQKTKSGRIVGDNGLYFSRRDTDGENAEAFPSAYVLRPAQIEDRMPRRVIGNGSALVVWTEAETLLGVGGATYGAPAIEWVQHLRVGLAAPDGVAVIGSAVGPAMGGDLVWIAGEGLVRMSAENIVNEIERHGLTEWWERVVAADGLSDGVVAFDALHRCVIVRNLKQKAAQGPSAKGSAETLTNVGLIWDAANDVMIPVDCASSRVMLQTEERSGRPMLLSVDEFGFLSRDHHGDCYSRGVELDPSDAVWGAGGAVSGHGTADGNTFVSSAGAQFKSYMIGSWLCVETSSGAHAARRILDLIDAADGASSRVQVESSWPSSVDGDTALAFTAGGVPVEWTSGVLTGRAPALNKHLTALRVLASGPSDTSSMRLRFEFWPADMDSNVLDVVEDAPTSVVHLTRDEWRCGTIYFAGPYSPAFVCRIAFVASEQFSLDRVTLICEVMDSD